MPAIDHDKIADIIREVAEDKIVPRFRQLAADDIRTKTGPTDLVTIADEEAEIALTRLLPQLLPGSLVLGEEAVSSGKVLRDILKDEAASVWIVDPVDGTGNFAHGKPIFGTMVALVSGGERVASWIYQIPEKRMVAAEKGAGVTLAGQRFVPPAKAPDDADFKTMRAFLSRKFIPPEIRPYVDGKAEMMGDMSTYTCCAYEYVEVMEGKSVFSLYKRIEPWDHLAGALMLEETGHYVRKWDGKPYRTGDLDGGLINAPSEAMWRRVYDTFLKEPLAARSSR